MEDVVEQFYLEKKDIYNRYLYVHHLYPRLSIDGILTATQTIGFKESSLESNGVALAARIDNLESDTIDQLWNSKKLMRTLGVRKKVRIIPPAMWRVFNSSLTPLDESELQHLITGIEPLIVALDKSMYQVYELLVDVTKNVLKEKTLTKTTFYKSLSKAVIDELAPSNREVWLWPSTVKERQTLGDSIIDALLPAVGFRVPIALERIAGKPGYHYSLVKTSETPDTAEFVRRFIHAHGPTDCDELALWANISFEHASRLWWNFPQEELVMVEWQEGSGYMLERDYNQISHLPYNEGIRFISPDDPLLHLKQRNLLVSGKTLFNYFFRSSNRPGMVLLDGQVIAGWRVRGKNRAFSLIIEDIGLPLGRIAKDELTAEISHIGTALGMKSEGFSLVNI